jgi:uncharacterized lipoprotein YbaY
MLFIEQGHRTEEQAVRDRTRSDVRHVLPRSSVVTRRLEVHRAAFAPSRVTVESYRNVMATWPYRG